jgi:hypothetical protein
MKGKLIKTDRGWEVEYEEDVPNLHYIAKQTIAILLHPDDVKQINTDGQVFDNIEARIAAYPDIEFEIVVSDWEQDYIKYNLTNMPTQYAKITKTAAFDKEGNAITRGYVEPKQEESSNWDEIFDEFAKFGKGKIGDWLKEFYLAPIKKQ